MKILNYNTPERKRRGRSKTNWDGDQTETNRRNLEEGDIKLAKLKCDKQLLNCRNIEINI